MERTESVPHRGMGVLELLTACLFPACVLGACCTSQASRTPLYSAREVACSGSVPDRVPVRYGPSWAFGSSGNFMPQLHLSSISLSASP